MLKLNLPSYDYLLKKQNDTIYIYDTARKKYILLTPEEWVRQHFVNYLTAHLKVPLNMISVESSLKYNKLVKRADILVYSTNGLPLLIVECKAPQVQLSNDTLFQISTYNKSLNVPLLAITNGLSNYFWRRNSINKEFVLTDMPADYSAMHEL
jgi:hypothetical protein